MFSNINKINNDVVLFVLRLFRENNMPINEFVLQKVIFSIKMDLGKNHPIYNHLPYYWYYYGPFSETIRKSFEDSKIYLNNIKDGFFLKNDIDECNFKVINSFPEIEDSAMKIISKGDYVYSSLTEDIYKNFAPLDMMYTFRYKIFHPTENDVFSMDGEQYINEFRFCQYKFSEIPFFQDFSLIFSKFSMQLAFLNESNVISTQWDVIRNPIRNLWFTFAEGLRCQNHDLFYDNRLNNWKILFNKSLSNLKIIVDNFVNETEKYVDFTDSNELDEKGKKFLSALISGYWEDD